MTDSLESKRDELAEAWSDKPEHNKTIVQACISEADFKAGWNALREELGKSEHGTFISHDFVDKDKAEILKLVNQRICKLLLLRHDDHKKTQQLEKELSEAEADTETALNNHLADLKKLSEAKVDFSRQLQVARDLVNLKNEELDAVKRENEFLKFASGNDNLKDKLQEQLNKISKLENRVHNRDSRISALEAENERLRLEINGPEDFQEAVKSMEICKLALKQKGE